MSHDTSPAVAVLAVDGGNSKTHVALIGSDGRVLAAIAGPTTSHQQVGLGPGTDRLVGLVGAALELTGLDPATALPAAVGSYVLAGADTPGDVRRLGAAFAARGLATTTIIVNDAYAPVRAGSEAGWGVGVICGAGINAAGIAPDGRTARFAAYGPISGDWGGGGDVGVAALGAAVRARDGRGPRTTLEHLVPAFFGLSRPMDVTNLVEHGHMGERELRVLSPTVFEAAQAGDAVARAIIDRLADELATMAVAIIRRLHVTRLAVPVTLAGGVFAAADPVFEDRITVGIHRVAPQAEVHRLSAPPVLGAALLGLDRLDGLSDAARAAAIARLRRELASVTEPTV